MRLASCPSGPIRLVGFDSFSQNKGEVTRMFWMDHLPPCQSLPYQLAKMAALAPRGADAIMPVECPTPLTSRPVQDGDRWPKSGPGDSSFLDKGQFLSTTTWSPRRAGSPQMEQRLPSSGLHWMTCVPTRQWALLVGPGSLRSLSLLNHETHNDMRLLKYT